MSTAIERDYPEIFARERQRRRWQAVAGIVLVAYLAFCCWAFDITLARLLGGFDKMWIVIRQMVYWKDFWSWDFSGIFLGLAQSLAMAFLGTILASLVALPLAFLAARTVVANQAVHHLIRRLLDLLRGVDQLIWALVFVRALGLGPLPGLLAIFTSDVGSLGKLYSEALENVDGKQIEGVRSVGAGRLQVYRFGYLPQIFPVLLSQTLYFIESNTRSATILGIVGAGGIGLQLSERMKVQYWDQAAFIIILILITVALVDWTSSKVRQRYIGTSD